MIKRIKARLFSSIMLLLAVMSLSAQQQLPPIDSLFNEGKYTEALTAYETVYNGSQVSPGMLLKMAFIHDGLGQYEKALLYLNQYYQRSANRLVIGKIEDLATENELSGYVYDDTHYFLALLNKYRIWFLGALSLTLLLLSIYIIRKIKEQEKPISAMIIQVFVVLLLAIGNNIEGQAKAIVSDQSLLRSGPSAGAEPVSMISKGHRVNVVEIGSVWTQILWEGDVVFIRNGRLLLI